MSFPKPSTFDATDPTIEQNWSLPRVLPPLSPLPTPPHPSPLLADALTFLPFLPFALFLFLHCTHPLLPSHPRSPPSPLPLLPSLPPSYFSLIVSIFSRVKFWKQYFKLLIAKHCVWFSLHAKSCTVSSSTTILSPPLPLSTLPLISLPSPILSSSLSLLLSPLPPL